MRDVNNLRVILTILLSTSTFFCLFLSTSTKGKKIENRKVTTCLLPIVYRFNETTILPFWKNNTK